MAFKSSSTLWDALHDLLINPNVVSYKSTPIRVGFVNAQDYYGIRPNTIITIPNNRKEPFTVTGSQYDEQLTQTLQDIKDADDRPMERAKSARSVVEWQ